MCFLMQIGYDMGDNTNYYSHPLSLSGEEYDIVSESNIGIPGMFIFKMGKDKNCFRKHIYLLY